MAIHKFIYLMLEYNIPASNAVPMQLNGPLALNYGLKLRYYT